MVPVITVPMSTTSQKGVHNAVLDMKKSVHPQRHKGELWKLQEGFPLPNRSLTYENEDGLVTSITDLYWCKLCSKEKYQNNCSFERTFSHNYLMMI